MKIVVNRCFGGFGLSEAACVEMGLPFDTVGGCYRTWEISRNDPKLVAAVEKLGDAANGEFADLEVVEIPDGVNWYIHDYDGQEEVHERHRSW